MAIRAALGGMAESPLRDGALGLLDALGYRSDRTLLMGDSPEEFLRYFNSDSLPSLTPKELQMLSEKWQGAAMLAQITDTEIRGKNSFVFNKGAIKSFVFIAVDLKKGSHARGDLTRMTRMINKMFAMPAIMIFRGEGRATIAVIHRRENKRDATRDVLEKVTLIKDISLAEPHRAHLDILADISLSSLKEWMSQNNKPPTFDSLQEGWLEKLDAEKLNRKFYGDLFAWFEWAKGEVEFPSPPESPISAQEHIIRMVTRLLFVWFIKEKGLVADEFFIEAQAKPLLRNWNPEDGDNYYRAILQNLFFATLNTEINRRQFSGKSNATHRDFTCRRYRDLLADETHFEELMNRSPFINGGLFDCLDSHEGANEGGYRIDCFTDNENHRRRLRVPNRLFFGAKDKRPGLLDIFHKYKFTVEESTPIEQEVALDPELLGSVFENLLASLNRKETGSFYTPRRIVDYMADESLLAYFMDKMQPAENHRKQLRDRLLNLLSYESADDSHSLNADEIDALMKAIANARVLDPAVGSGAFPMGILQKLTNILNKIDPHNIRWRELQKDRAIAETKKAYNNQDKTERDRRTGEISETFERYADGFGRKVFLIQNSIFGVDIQPIACQIAKLRFFITLAIEQEPNQNPKDNYGIRPLPNLETRFVAADSLIGLGTPAQSVLGNEEVKQLENELSLVRERYFNARIRGEKRRLQKEDKNLRNKMARLLKSLGFGHQNAERIAAWDPYNQNAVADWFDSEWMFGVADGFDIVIGNPPYVKKENMSPEIKARLPLYYKERKQLKEIGWCDDLYVHFIFKGAALARKAGGILTYITNDSFVGLKTKERIRKMFLENDLMQLTACPDSTFAQTIYVAIFILARKKSAAHKYESGKLVGNDYHYESLGEVSYNVARKLPDCRLLYRSPMMSVYERLADLPPFENYFRILDTGIHSGNVRHLIFFEDEKRKGLSRLVQGRQIERWRIDWNSPNAKFKWCNPNYVPRDRPGIGRGGKPSDRNEYWEFCGDRKNHHKPERLLLRQSDDDLIAAWHSKAVHRQFYTDNTLFTILSKSLGGESHGLKYAMALLNSRLLNSLYQFLSQEKGKTLAQIKTGLVKALPFVDAENTDEVVALVDKIIAAKHANPAADVSQLEGEIDAIVYRLYGLIAAEIRLVESVHKKD